MSSNDSAGNAGNGKGDNGKSEKIVFFVGKKRFEVTTSTLTVRQILVDYAKEDAAATTLVEREKDEQVKLTDLDQEIHLKDGMHFVVFYNTPTTVS